MIHELRAALLGLTAFRGLLEEPLMADVRALLDALAAQRGEAALDAYTNIFYKLRQGGKAGAGGLAPRPPAVPGGPPIPTW